MGRHSYPGTGEPADEPAEPDDANPPSGRLSRPSSGRIPRAESGWQGRRRREDGARRGVSTGVIVALVTVVVLVGAIILWRFFGDALSRRSSDAAQQCLGGTATVAVVADPSIADSRQHVRREVQRRSHTGRRQVRGSDGHAERLRSRS